MLDRRFNGAVALAAMLCASPMAFGTCPGEGDCCVANGSRACDDKDCCKTICGFDPFCCFVEWDGICANAANELCADCTSPPEPDSDCCVQNDTPGCDDQSCQDTVCAIDPFCCDIVWDQSCADKALDECDACDVGPPEPAPIDCCEANGTPGCNDPSCQAQVCAQDLFCCFVEWDQICADAAAEQCDECAGPPPDSDCCVQNETPGCDDQSCQDTVCAIDMFCCDIVWDQSCADLALDECDVCGGGGTPAGDCCAANGSPGCDDDGCEDLICNRDPYCCIVEWDAICANEANTHCAGCFGEPGGDCCAANGSPGCDDQACEDLICAQDPFCCGVQWDEVCADAAVGQCDACASASIGCAGDINLSGATNAEDLELVLSQFGDEFDASDLNTVLGDFGCGD